MLFFPTLYEDELLYSAIARYHIRSGNINYKHTTIDLFGRKTVSASIYLPSNISTLINNLPVNYIYNEEDIIIKHTLYPFYTAFLTQDTSDKILNSMKGNNGGDIYARAGICASTVPIPKYLKFCNMCLEEDIEKYGETYWHRVHQVPGVKVCPKHKILLEDSIVEINTYNKQEYIAASTENCIINNIVSYPKDILEKLYVLSRDIEYLLNSTLAKKDSEWHRNNYISYLIKKGIATPKGRINQEELVSDFKKFYGDEFLDILESNVNYSNSQNWLSDISRKIRYTIHPMRQLLFIRYLDVNIDDLFNYKYEYKPFGEGPWTCFNKASDHYRKNVINDVVINRSYNTKRITGKFCCTCGYIYLKEDRGDIDNNKDKIKVLDFGEVWKNKLIELVTQRELSIQEIANELDLDWNSTYKHIIKLGLEPNFKSSNKKINALKIEDNSIRSLKDKKLKINAYRNEILEILKLNCNITRSAIKSLNPSLYMYLQKNDREWLELNLPAKKIPIRNNEYRNIDWENRDNEILLNVQNLVYKLINTDELPKKINVHRIGKTLNIYNMLTKNKDKLPKTFKYLDDVIESRYDYIIRKIKWAINKLDSEGNYLNTEFVAREAKIYGKDKINFKEIIDKEIIEYSKKYKKV